MQIDLLFLEHSTVSALFRAQHSTVVQSYEGAGDKPDEYSNHGVMMILSGQGVFLRRLLRLCLSTQGLFQLTPLQRMYLKNQVHAEQAGVKIQKWDIIMFVPNSCDVF